MHGIKKIHAAGTVIEVDFDDMLGSGGTADVFAAHDPYYGKSFAVKVNKSELGIARIKHEAQVYRRLGARTMGVPNMIWTGKLGSKHAIILPCFHRQYELTAMVQRLSKEDVWSVSKKLLMCLQEIHLKCVIHADIKPSNIFLHVQNGSYQVYLIDFGYALIVNERRVSSQHEPSSGSAAAIRGGTILFSSINWQHDRPISYRDDLESLVYTLLYLRFGQLPWWNPRSGHIVLDEDVVKKLKQTWVDLPWAPTELVDLWHYARELRVDEKPDYGYILGTIFRDDKHA